MDQSDYYILFCYNFLHLILYKNNLEENRYKYSNRYAKTLIHDDDNYDPQFFFNVFSFLL